MNRYLWPLAGMLLFALAFLGCVDGGEVSMPSDADMTQIAGRLLLGGEHDHAAASDDDDDHDHDDDHDEDDDHDHEGGAGEPLADFPVTLIVGAAGRAGVATSNAAGRFLFEVPEGLYHLGFRLPANLEESGSPETHWLLRVEASDEPVGLEIIITPEPDEAHWHITGLIFDDEDGDGLRGDEEAVLETLDAEVPFGSRRDFVINPADDQSADTGDDGHGHGHSHG